MHPRRPSHRNPARGSRGRLIRLAVASAAVAAGAAVAAPAAVAAEARLLLGLERPGGTGLALERVADPSSPDHRDYLTLPELRQRYGASPATVRRVQGYLRSRGIDSSVDPTRTFVAATMTEDQAAAAFGEGIIRIAEAQGVVGNAPGSLPRPLRGLVREVAGLEQFEEDAQTSRRRQSDARRDRIGTVELPPRTGRAEGCVDGREIGLGGQAGRVFPGTKPFTPNQIQTAFGFDPLHRAGVQGRGQSIALVEFGAGFKAQDMSVFAKCFGLPEPKVRAHTVGIPRPPVPFESGGTGEATLDIQTLMLAAPRARIEVLLGGPRTPFAEPLAAALDAKRLGRLPSVVSISYGVCEPLAAASGAGTADRRLFERVAQAAGLLGTSVVVSSGDSGSSACAHQVGALPLGEVVGTVVTGSPSVAWPASSPSVTAVGGTSMRLDRANRIVRQRPWNDTQFGIPAVEVIELPEGDVVAFTAGGGTGGASRFHRQPGYQADAGLGAAQRLVPDVSMYASDVPGIVTYCSAFNVAARVGECPPSPENGFWSAIGGTSFAAPLLAGGIALANEQAAKASTPPLGFVNPLIYERQTRRAALRDVTTGSNALFPVGCCQARVGYDQATGWGTVDVSKLSQVARQRWQARADVRGG